MTDPLDALRAPIVPADPDPAFAARLRERLQRALLARSPGDSPAEHAEQEGVAMSTGQTSATEHVDELSAADIEWGPTLQPYLGVNDARRALDWYVEVFGAQRRGAPYVMPDGSIGHAELRIGDAVLALAEYGPEPPRPGEAATGPAHSLFVSVPDVDQTVRVASSRGAAVERQPRDESYGRTGVIIDPFGHRWMINTRPRSATRARPGDIIYLTVFVRDEEQMREFYGTVLSRRVIEQQSTPTVSVWGIGHPPATGSEPLGAVPVYRVADVGAAAERARALGGTAGEPEDFPYGRRLSVVDPEGNHFEVWQPPGE
jgi:uncharacterized glyoxalase superfamily protein PhnB